MTKRGPSSNRLSLSKQLLFDSILALIAITCKILYVKLFFVPETGLYQRTFTATMLNWTFYFAIALVFVINFITATHIVPFFKRLSHNEPVIVGYSLFFTAVMFVVEGLSGFYNHFISFVETRKNTTTQPINLFTSAIMPFLSDLLCVLCAIAFYQMAMSCFNEDNEPVRSVSISCVPVIWASVSVLNTMVISSTKTFIQPELEQLLLSLFTLGYLMGTFRYFMLPDRRRKQSVFTIFCRLSYSVVSVAVVIPYLILMIFGVHDSIISMPYFAISGVAIYALASMLNFILSANVFQVRAQHR